MSTDPQELICMCGFVERETIEDAVELGLTFERLQTDLDVCNGCQSCYFKIQDIIKKINTT